ncbi:B3 domain-containing protein REM14-like [Tripterygium wilfordii]|uniref:B3 domain-containing protein REM14-like n=1 Tax=Tripterygium wilfordii TaxID=458696 RepID=UPI0018F84DAC|nr:B3 domain-containing protein REM14-like [Tripterygium wilfordii]
MKQTEVLPSKPHFFKPLIPGFHQEFLIPVAFLKYLNGKDHVKAVLRSPEGKVWTVKINGRRIESGWAEFAREHGLQVGDFLVFGHAGDMVFDVMVFDSSGSEREYPHFNVKEEKESWEEEPEKKVTRELTRKKKAMHSSERKATLAIKNPYFETTVKPYHFKDNRMYLPMSFARSNGLNNRVDNCKITLMNQKGRSWSAYLKRKFSCGSAYIGIGWAEFRIQNKLKKGDSFIVELINNGRNPQFLFRRK